MAKKCSGCGIELQSEDKNLPGYLPESKIKEKDAICQRCFKISNYGAYLPIDLNDKDYKNEVLKVLKKMDVVVVVVDLIDFEGSFDKELISKNSTNFLYKLMVETSTGKNRLVAGIPKGTEVAHRTGTSFTENGITPAINNIGIVTLPNGKKYAISVFVSDSKENFGVNEKIISDISKVVYESLNKPKSGFFFNWK